jgi:hypothetical protein
LKAFSLGPPGLTLEKVCAVSVSGLADDNDLTLVLMREGKLLSIPTTHIQRTGELRGSIDKLGIFGVAKKSDVDGEVVQVPTRFALEQNYPNPFNPTTNIEFRIAKVSATGGSASGGELVTLKIFDVLGREVATLVNEERRAGIYRVTWDASRLPSGVYFYRIRAGDYVETKKMVFAK